MKEKNYQYLVNFCVFLFGGAMAFFVALAVLEQLEINFWIDGFVSIGIGIGVACFIMVMIGIHRWLEGFALIKVVMIVAGIALSSLTIFGVYSGMQSSWFRNITKSEAHQRMSTQADILSGLAQEQTSRNRITRAGETTQALVETNKSLNEMEITGAQNAENQWAQGLANTFGGNPGAWAFGRHTMVGAAIDIVFYLSAWFFFYGRDYYRKGAGVPFLKRKEEKEKRENTASEPIPVAAQGQGGNGVKPPSPTQPERPRREMNMQGEDFVFDDEPERRFEPEPTMAEHRPKGGIGFQSSSSLSNVPEKKIEVGSIESSENRSDRNYEEMNRLSQERRAQTKAKKKAQLKRYLEDHPAATKQEMCQYLEISLNTLNKYLEEMGYQ
jgi:hypothetical protein